MLYKGVALVIGLAALLAACGENGPSRKSERSAKSKVDVAELKKRISLPKDPEEAMRAIEETLSKSIVIRGRTLIVTDAVTPNMESYYLPVGTQWTISCGIGLYVYFGNGVRGSDAGNTVAQVSLGLAPIQKNVCDIVGPRVNEKIEALLAQK
jgi:hypothetical protein